MCSTLAVAEEELPQQSFVAFILWLTAASILAFSGENDDKLQILPLRNIVYILLFIDTLYCCTFFRGSLQLLIVGNNFLDAAVGKHFKLSCIRSLAVSLSLYIW